MPLGVGKSDANMMRTAWELSSGLLSFIVALGLGWWFGGLLDRWLSTSPWLTVLFVAFGFAAGALNVQRALSRAMRAADRKSIPAERPPSGRG